MEHEEKRRLHIKTALRLISEIILKQRKEIGSDRAIADLWINEEKILKQKRKISVRLSNDWHSNRLAASKNKKENTVEEIEERQPFDWSMETSSERKEKIRLHWTTTDLRDDDRTILKQKEKTSLASRKNDRRSIKRHNLKWKYKEKVLVRSNHDLLRFDDVKTFE
jgi:hypothetical protein